MANRNGHVGDYDAFYRPKMTMDEIFKRSRAIKKAGGYDPTDGRSEIAHLPGATLYRYHLGSQALHAGFQDVGAVFVYGLPEYASMASAFGLVDHASGKTVATFSIIEEDEPAIYEIDTDKLQRPASDLVLAALVELDIPPARNYGAELSIAHDFDCWYADGEWAFRDPQYVVAVTFETMCFALHPPAREQTTILVPYDPMVPVGSDPDGDTRWHYGQAAWARGEKMPDLRPGYSSWTVEDIKQLKVVHESAWYPSLVQTSDEDGPRPTV